MIFNKFLKKIKFNHYLKSDECTLHHITGGFPGTMEVDHQVWNRTWYSSSVM